MSPDLPPLDTDPHHPAAAYRIQLGDADLDPWRLKIVEQHLRDGFGERFEQIEVAAGERALDIAHDIGIIERVLEVVGFAGAAVGQGDFQIDLQGLRRALFPFVDADQGVDLEFAQKDDVHCGFLSENEANSMRYRQGWGITPAFFSPCSTRVAASCRQSCRPVSRNRKGTARISCCATLPHASAPDAS